MAGKDKKPAARASASPTKVTRIVATDEKKTVKKTPKVQSPKAPTDQLKLKNGPLGRLATPFIAMGRYFKGAWYELKQVRWPNRRATLSLTAAMLVFTTFFVVFILLLDALFKYLFQQILG